LNTRQALIARALRQRYKHVGKTVESLIPGDFNAQEEFVSRAREFVRRNGWSTTLVDQFHLSAQPQRSPRLGDDGSQGSSPQTPRERGRYTENNQTLWFESDFDCLVSLAKMACGEDVGSKECSPPSGLDFLQTLREAARDSNESFRLLTTRYAHPLNFSQPPEQFVREHVLERLMVKDRARLERPSAQTIDDDVLLRLNLIAIHSSLRSDLRFLDAVNYYFELLSAIAKPKSENNWLFVSFLTLYARALWIRSEEIAICA
jgi:hypothetical protein